MNSSPLRVGTADWSVPSRYAAEMPPGDSHLARYVRRLDAAEINSSFQRRHQRKTYERWAQSVPAAFRFSAKLPKSISHEQGLAGCGALLDRFTAEVAGLGDKLGVLLLLQLPPKFALEKRVADRFFRDLRRRIDVPVACEQRHASWFKPDVSDWLVRHRVARVAADPAPVPGAGEPAGWNGLAYYRWHGSPRIYYSDYDAAALAALRKRLEAQRQSGVPVWCIFDNTASGAALGNALAMAAHGRASALAPAAGGGARARSAQRRTPRAAATLCCSASRRCLLSGKRRSSRLHPISH